MSGLVPLVAFIKQLLVKLQKQICRTVAPSLAASLEPLAYCRNVASLSLNYRCYFSGCSAELTQLVPLPFSGVRSTHSDRWHNFSVAIPRYYKDVYVNSFFHHTARRWSSLPIEWFPLTYNLNGFNCSFLLKRFPVCFNLFVLVIPCLVVAAQLCNE